MGSDVEGRRDGDLNKPWLSWLQQDRSGGVHGGPGMPPAPRRRLVTHLWSWGAGGGQGEPPGSAQVRDQRMILPFPGGLGQGEQSAEGCPRGSHQAQFLGSRGVWLQNVDQEGTRARGSPEPMHRPPALRSPEDACKLSSSTL